MKDRCLVLLSGGQDSTTCLFLAKELYKEVYAVTFNYSQKHIKEIEAAIAVANLANIKHHDIIQIPKWILKGTSPLVNNAVELGQYGSREELPGGIEPTFVPCRNMLFLTIIANRAYNMNINDIIIGVSAVDYGGYPDCEIPFISAMEQVFKTGLKRDINIITPLIHLSKKDTVFLATKLDGCITALAYSHTCYNGTFPPCGKCHACILREEGFKEAGFEDPIKRRLI